MNITFLVGNGFDISAGINTSYEEFYKWYCDESRPSDETESDAVKKLKKSIKNREENKNWSDLEIGLAEYTSEIEFKNSQEFIDGYEDIHDNIVKFIIKSEQAYDYTLITPETLENLSDGIANFYQELRPAEADFFKKTMDANHADNTQIKFLSFNYTNILDSYIIELAKDKKALKTWNFRGSARSMTVDPEILHVHGTTDHYPALGVSEEEYITDPDLLQNPDIHDMFLKRNHTDYNGETWYDEGENIINNSHLICIFGMSLGQSDSLWWKTIMSWLSQSSSRHLVIFWHSAEEVDTISVVRRRRREEPVKDKLMAYCQVPLEESPKIRERIHCVINAKKMLAVPRVTDPANGRKPN